MHRIGQKTTLQERVAIGKLAMADQTDAQIAIKLDCSVWTVRKWRRIYIHQGRAGFKNRIGRPATGPLGTISEEVQATIRHLRETHPGWGPDTLLIAIRADPTWKQQRLPSRSRIATFLKQSGLTRRYLKHSELPEPAHQKPEVAHQEWQMDAQAAMQVKGIGSVSVINVLDVASRLKVESCPRVNTPKPAAADYYVTLRRAFLTYGLPQRLSVDHDTVFFDNTTPSPFPTRLHLWLLALGIEVVFTGIRRPTDHAAIERTHQTMTNQALLGQSWPNQKTLWAGLDERRTVLNHAMPIRALHQLASLQAYPEAAFSGRDYRPEWEKELLDLDRVYQYLAQGCWFRINNAGTVHLGTYEYRFGYRYRGQTMEITFDPSKVAFVCQPEGATEPVTVAARGLTKADLMGDLAWMLALPAYQLAFPFSPEEQRRLSLIECLSGTTL
jgi:hypothetical protein